MPPPLDRRLDLAVLPTPLQPADRLGAALGMVPGALWVKRDDLTGLAGGGNKARKLEYLCADAMGQGADVLVTGGGAQSNHVRMTAAAANRLGLDCTVIVAGARPETATGNGVLLELLGPEVVHVGDRGPMDYYAIEAAIDDTADRLAAQGRRPYRMPIGGATSVGALGYVRAALELREQAAAVWGGEAVDVVVVADGSGGGLAGELKAHQNVVARRQYFRSVSGPGQDHIHIFATRDMNERGGGYGWVFYLGNGHANVGAGVSTRTLERTGRNLKDFFDRFLEEPVLAEWLKEAKPEGSPKSWSLRTGMWGASRYTWGLMLVGDAGSMIHPISGEGVGYAMESGRLAASFAHAAHAGKDFSASLLSGHEKQLRKQRAREQLSGVAVELEQLVGSFRV